MCFFVYARRDLVRARLRKKITDLRANRKRTKKLESQRIHREQCAKLEATHLLGDTTPESANMREAFAAFMKSYTAK